MPRAQTQMVRGARMTAQDDPGTIVKTSGCLQHGQND